VVNGNPYAYQQQQPQAQAPARELTTLEKAEAALANGQGAQAIHFYREYLKEWPDDTMAMRALALALVNERRWDQAAAVMAMAYEKNPKLAYQTPDASILPGGLTGLRKLVTAGVTYAGRVKTSSSWLLVAVLMQAEGRPEVALKMLERSKAEGLNAKVLVELTVALTQK
jgi:tetratricopeptide (TPR) repeat protein